MSTAWLAVTLALAPGVAAAAASPAVSADGTTMAATEAALPAQYRQWLEEVAVLIRDDERQAFLALGKDYQRDAFIDRFWRERDPYPDTGRNELKERWTERVKEARSRFRRLDDERARALLLNGPPLVSRAVRCRSSFWPLDLWFYPYGSDAYRSAFALIFYQPGGSGPFKLWHSSFGREQLVTFDKEAACRPEDSEYLRAAMRWIDGEGIIGYQAILERTLHPPPVANSEWVATFNSYSTDLPEAAELFAAQLHLGYPGWYQNRTALEGLVEIPLAAVAPAELAGQRSFHFLLTGEVLSGPALFDSFRYKFDFPSAESARPLAVGEAPAFPLIFQRYLRPGGPYRLILKIENLASGRFFRVEREIEVPRITEKELPPPLDPRLATVLAETNAALARGESSLKLVPPMGDLLAGLVRFDTLVTGSQVARVRFVLDGEEVLTKTRPPFSVELDLGDFPRTHTLAVRGYAADGAEVASDELLVNVSGSRFRVRLVEPRRGSKHRQSLRARAEVEVPKGDTLAKVEIYLNEDLLATLFQSPYVQPLVLPPGLGEEGGALTYVRAVATLTDGSTAEDVVFVNAPDFGEQLAVNLVELYASVLDGDGRPVEGLGRERFRVEEDGEEQEISRFEAIADRPIHAALLLDTSASMQERLEPSREAALEFFQQSIRPQDRVALLTFNDRPYLAVPFTKDLAAFTAGLAGLKAERGTALYDSLIYGLFYFTGVSGQRALVVISDGKDEASRFGFEEALDYARRAGITIYTVSVGVDKKDPEARRALTRLADETGGRSYFLSSTAELATAYARIEDELRSQYLVAYQSKNVRKDRAFRKVELKVEGRGLEVKAMRGYYP